MIIKNEYATTVLPELFCLLPDKQTTTYHRLFTLIQSKCIDHQIALSPSTILLDFEVAVHNVVRSVFPELDTLWLSFPLRSSPFQKTTRVRSELKSTLRS